MASQVGGLDKAKALHPALAQGQTGQEGLLWVAVGWRSNKRHADQTTASLLIVEASAFAETGLEQAVAFAVVPGSANYRFSVADFVAAIVSYHQAQRDDP